MRIPIVQLDAFTDRPFGGNPAAVAFFDQSPDDSVLQAIALEMNLAETAFPIHRPDGDWDLRWFTPRVEVDLCGHATLASAAALAREGLIEDKVTFHTRSGALVCRVTTSADGKSAVTMDFPSSPATPREVSADLVSALGCDVLAAGTSFDLVAELESAETVRDLDPDLDGVVRMDTRAVVVGEAW